MAKGRKVRVTDAETAEHLTYAVVPVRTRREEFVMVTQGALARITKQGWPDGDYVVLMALMSRLDWENFIHVDVSQLATEMGRDRTGVSRSISRLIAAGALHRGPRVGRSYCYRLDPNLGYKGSPEGQANLRAKIARQWGVQSTEPDAQIDGQLEMPGLDGDA